jgi:hypothetical protein
MQQLHDRRILRLFPFDYSFLQCRRRFDIETVDEANLIRNETLL